MSRSSRKPWNAGGTRRAAARWFCAAVLFCVARLAAQPANDSFADAEELSGLYGTVTNNLGQATGEPAEPSHAGFPAIQTIWYKWTAPRDGEVQWDTLASPGGPDTVLAVYTGETLTTFAPGGGQ